MNHLLIGTEDKTDRLVQVTDFTKPFLLIDDGPIADSFIQRVPPRRKIFTLDWTRDSFNPLFNRQYLWDVLPHLFPKTTTLTREDADYLWLNCLATLDHDATLLDIPRALSNRSLSSRDNFLQDNWQHIFGWDRKRYDAAVGRVRLQIDTLLINPTLRRVLTQQPRTFAPDKIVIAKINRAEWGDFYSFVLASLLIGQSQGQVIVPDFGFYGRPLHTSLMRQKRLTAGLNFLAEVPLQLSQALLTIKDKTAYRTTTEDAERLLPYFPKATKPSHFTELASDEYLQT